MLRGAHAQRAPELRERALAGTLNVVICTACQHKFPAGVELVYTDVPRGQWVYVAPRAAVAWQAVEHQARQLIDTALASSPPASELPHGRLRVVLDTDELRERLAIWDADLDDAVVECVKLHCLRERPDVRRAGERIRVASIDDRVLALTSGLQPGAPRCGWQVPRAIVHEIGSDPRWRAELPDLFGAAFVSIDRYLT